MAKEITTPSLENERELNDVIENNTEDIEALGRKWKVGHLRFGTKRKISKILMEERETDEDKVTCKCAAAFLLNSHLKIVLFHWLLWRWFYYVKEYTDSELSPIIEACKKKVDAESYFVNIIYLTEMRDTMMTMTRKEVRRFLQGRHGEQHGA